MQDPILFYLYISFYPNPVLIPLLLLYRGKQPNVFNVDLLFCCLIYICLKLCKWYIVLLFDIHTLNYINGSVVYILFGFLPLKLTFKHCIFKVHPCHYIQLIFCF